MKGGRERMKGGGEIGRREGGVTKKAWNGDESPREGRRVKEVVFTR